MSQVLDRLVPCDLKFRQLDHIVVRYHSCERRQRKSVFLFVVQNAPKCYVAWRNNRLEEPALTIFRIVWMLRCTNLIAYKRARDVGVTIFRSSVERISKLQSLMWAVFTLKERSYFQWMTIAKHLLHYCIELEPWRASLNDWYQPRSVIGEVRFESDNEGFVEMVALLQYGCFDEIRFKIDRVVDLFWRLALFFFW